VAVMREWGREAPGGYTPENGGPGEPEKKGGCVHLRRRGKEGFRKGGGWGGGLVWRGG